MTIDTPKPPSLKGFILLETRDFLVSVQAGASPKYLISRLYEIRRKEAELMAKEGLMLSPYVWRILINHFNHGISSEIIDTY